MHYIFQNGRVVTQGFQSVTAPPISPTASATDISHIGAGGVLSGKFPNPGFAVNMVTQEELNNVILSLRNLLVAKGVITEDEDF